MWSVLCCSVLNLYLFDVHQPATTIKPLTAEQNNTDHLLILPDLDGKPWILVFKELKCSKCQRSEPDWAINDVSKRFTSRALLDGWLWFVWNNVWVGFIGQKHPRLLGQMFYQSIILYSRSVSLRFMCKVRPMCCTCISIVSLLLPVLLADLKFVLYNTAKR